MTLHTVAAYIYLIGAAQRSGPSFPEYGPCWPIFGSSTAQCQHSTTESWGV